MDKACFRIKPLIAVMALVGGAAQVQAADSTGAIEEVFVQGSPIKESQMAAIDAKKNASNVVDVISSDTIGRFPDQNLADSLGRVPGVAIERDQGQARYINLRGTPFRYTALAFDGVDINGADDGRVPRFDSFPSVITRRIEVNKAILPSMPGESVAGFINIHTFSPFDKKGFSLAADVGAGQQQLGDGDISKYSLRTSYSGNNWGIVVYASENSREQVTDNRELDIDVLDNNEWQVNDLDYRSYLIERKDAAQGGSIEFQGDGVLTRAFVSTLHSEFTDSEERNQFAFSLDGAVGVTGEGVPAEVTRMLQFGNYETSTHTTTLGADWQFSEWAIEARINSTATTADMNLPLIRAGSETVASYDLSSIEDPLLYIDPGLDNLDFAYNLDMRVFQNLDIDSTKFKVDASRNLSLFGVDTKIDVGVQHDEREADGYAMSTSLDSRNLVAIDVDAFNTGTLWDSNTTNTIAGTIYDNKGIAAAWKAHDAWEPTPLSDGDKIIIDETITAWYAMAQMNYDWGNFIVGARQEFTDYLSYGQTGSAENDFSHVLPSVHLNVDLAENHKWRLSFTSSVTRPSYTAWRATISESPLTRSITEGNPHLKAEESSGFDTSYEWYFSDASLLSVGAFYREIDNVMYTDAVRLQDGWTHNKPVNGGDGKIQGVEVNLQASASEWLPEPFDGLGVSTNLTLLDSEFTNIHGDTLGLPGTSDSVFNASVFYEKWGFSARLNYQHRDEWISPLESPDEVWAAQKRVDLTLSYDLPLDLVGAKTTIYLNGNNLTNEVDVRYAANGTVNQVESYGRSWLAGVRVSY